MLKFLFFLFLFALLLNFAWEITQMPYYSPEGMGDFSNLREFIKIHWQASLLDAAGIVAAYLLVSFFMGRKTWVRTWNRGWIGFVFLLIAGQAVVEYFGVQVYEKWAYAPAMPLVFGAGLLPLLQMLILPVFAVVLARNRF